MTTMTTTRLILMTAVEGKGEGPMIRLLELAQVLGQPSPHGTTEALERQLLAFRSISVSAWGSHGLCNSYMCTWL